MLGATVLWRSLPRTENRDLFTLAWVSFDLLVPIIELNAAHKQFLTKIEYSAGVLTYFYVHKSVGYLLGSFLLAGLAGLTQK